MIKGRPDVFPHNTPLTFLSGLKKKNRSRRPDLLLPHNLKTQKLMKTRDNIYPERLNRREVRLVD
jgi:hypothetical protein